MTVLPPWIVITNYPKWPSPYFAHFERYASGLPVAFRPGLEEAGTAPGVINLHRLKRLYRDPAGGTAAMPAAEAFLARLAAMKDAGWQVAWTVHGLLPVDGPPPGPADRAAAGGVLELADAVLCHTRSDASALHGRTRAPAWVTGWTCLDPPGGPPDAETAALAARMRAQEQAWLLLGNLTGYKDAPATVSAFLDRTRRACLTVAGECRDSRDARALEHAAAASGGRVHLHLRRVAPGQAGHLYAAADAAVCPYRADGPYSFLGDVFYPGSVGTAAGFAVPVIAPALPAIEEITAGRSRWLARPGTLATLGDAMAAAESELPALAASRDPREGHPAASGPGRWREVTAVYLQAAGWLARQPGSPHPRGQREDDRSA